MEEQQTCTTCQATLPMSKFRVYTSGRICRQCKTCTANKNREWRHANVEKKRQNTKRDYANHTGRYRAQNAAYRARKKNSMPKWLSDDQLKQIEEIYTLARQADEPMHVDHIVPLQGKNVCGLHVPWNLQILPAQENRIKHNLIGI